MSSKKYLQSSNNRNNRQGQQQQIFQQQLTQDQAEIRYYVFQNMQFLINLLYSMEEILNYFNSNLDHPMVTIGMNKIILQINLANSTSCDLQQRYKDTQDVQELLKAKQLASNLIFEATKQLRPDLKIFVQDYIENCLSQKVVMKQIQPLPSMEEGQFNQQVVQDIFNAISKTDKEINMIQMQRNYELPKVLDIIELANQYQYKTKSKLKVNFSNQLFSDNEKQMFNNGQIYQTKQNQQSSINNNFQQRMIYQQVEKNFK